MKQHVNHIILVLLIVLAIFLLSCSPKTLAVFFDGVPVPGDTVSEIQNKLPDNQNGRISATETSMEAVVRYYFHSPYKQNECATCHNPRIMGKLQEPVPDLCYTCHDDFSATFSLLHGPVEAGECMMCHKPHLSTFNNLLVRSVRELCFDCHDQSDIMQNENHSDIGEDDCTDCHNPHGGNERYFFN